jgi:hypothetical protein
VTLKNAALEYQEDIRKLRNRSQKKKENRKELARKVLAELPATQNSCTHGLLQGTLSRDCAAEDVRRTPLKKPRS